MDKKIWILMGLYFLHIYDAEGGIFQKIVPRIKGKEDKKTVACYEELGCFPMDYPWTSARRPLFPPYTPIKINTRLYLYTRNVNKRYNVGLWPKISLKGSDYKADRPATVFITHGFAQNGNYSWMAKLKDAYLKNVDANVFITDWGDGAERASYLLVSSNARIVGAELARFGKYLLKNGLKPKNLHLIGHSLGTHITSYMAKGIQEVAKAGRFTALDPAQPCFEGLNQMVRVDKTDAEWVDSVHSDSKPFFPNYGMGFLKPTGHIDFYLNGGFLQPGCGLEVDTEGLKVSSLLDLANLPVEVLFRWVKCSHERSFKVFTAALNYPSCMFWGLPIKDPHNFIDIQNNKVQLGLYERKMKSCTMESCSLLGLNATDKRFTGSFIVKTTAKEPFCVKA